jgi:hypothetical protein
MYFVEYSDHLLQPLAVPFFEKLRRIVGQLRVCRYVVGSLLRHILLFFFLCLLLFFVNQL